MKREKYICNIEDLKLAAAYIGFVFIGVPIYTISIWIILEYFAG